MAEDGEPEQRKPVRAEMGQRTEQKQRRNRGLGDVRVGEEETKG